MKYCLHFILLALMSASLFSCGQKYEKIELRVTDAPLYVAIREGDLQEVKRILEEDPRSLNRRDGTLRETPLHQAAAAGQVEIARFLLESGAAVNAFDGRRLTPLTSAMDANASEEMIQLIRSYGGDD